MIKSYGNVFVDKPSGFSYITYADNPASFDAYEVAKPSDQLPLPALANILDSYESGVVKVMGVE